MLSSKLSSAMKSATKQLWQFIMHKIFQKSSQKPGPASLGFFDWAFLLVIEFSCHKGFHFDSIQSWCYWGVKWLNSTIISQPDMTDKCASQHCNKQTTNPAAWRLHLHRVDWDPSQHPSAAYVNVSVDLLRRRRRRNTIPASDSLSVKSAVARPL